jgi:hypothetical protein
MRRLSSKDRLSIVAASIKFALLRQEQRVIVACKALDSFKFVLLHQLFMIKLAQIHSFRDHKSFISLFPVNT